ALYILFFWRYLHGDPPFSDASAAERRILLRANRLSARLWSWSLLYGGLGVVALVLALRVTNRFVPLPPQTLPPELALAPRITVLSLLAVAAPIAGIVEEAAFR